MLTKNPFFILACRIIIPLIVILSLYLQANGEISPGGGFQAGMIAATILILLSLLIGVKSILLILPIRLLKILATLGLIIYIGVGLYSLFWRKNLLDYSALMTNRIASEQLGIILVELGIFLAISCGISMIYFSLTNRGR